MTDRETGVFATGLKRRLFSRIQVRETGPIRTYALLEGKGSWIIEAVMRGGKGRLR
jgi:hypothetical protein